MSDFGNISRKELTMEEFILEINKIVHMRIILTRSPVYYTSSDVL